MPPESTRGPNLRELESLRITRTEALPRPRRWPWAVALIGVIGLIVAGYEAWLHTLGRPLEVETATATLIAGNQPHALISGSGYVVTRDKYITVGTKILGQIVEEPIEEGRNVRKGDLLARIDDRDYEAQLRQAIADRQMAQANLELARLKADRVQTLFGQQVVSRDQLDDAENARSVAEANLNRADAEIRTFGRETPFQLEARRVVRA